MKKKRSLGIGLVIIFSVTGLLAQTEQLSVPLTNPGKPYSLDVNLLNGSIKVNSYNGTAILIEVSPGAIPNDREIKETENGMKRISSSDGYEITANENNNVVSVHNNSFNRTINLSLKIPQDVKLRLTTVNNGDIEVENVKGELEVNNVNGAIKINNTSGSVVATTINGVVKVNFIQVDPDAAMAFSSLTGNVDITFPSDIKANLKLKSDMGEIYSDFDIEIDKSQPRVNRIAQSGMYKLEVEDWVFGKINGGGPEFLIKNMQGNIYIRKVK